MYCNSFHSFAHSFSPLYDMTCIEQLIVTKPCSAPKPEKGQGLYRKMASILWAANRGATFGTWSPLCSGITLWTFFPFWTFVSQIDAPLRGKIFFYLKFNKRQTQNVWLHFLCQPKTLRAVLQLQFLWKRYLSCSSCIVHSSDDIRAQKDQFAI